VEENFEIPREKRKNIRLPIMYAAFVPPKSYKVHKRQGKYQRNGKIVISKYQDKGSKNSFSVPRRKSGRWKDI